MENESRILNKKGYLCPLLKNAGHIALHTLDGLHQFVQLTCITGKHFNPQHIHFKLGTLVNIIVWLIFIALSVPMAKQPLDFT